MAMSKINEAVTRMADVDELLHDIFSLAHAALETRGSSREEYLRRLITKGCILSALTYDDDGRVRAEVL